MSTGLKLEGITVRYGGNLAVEGLNLTAEVGRITGLIGPNGAGKTTTFNACGGLVRPSAGRVVMDGHDVTKLPPHKRAQLGLGRTFQRIDLFDSLSVAENVALGREAGYAASNPLSQVRATRRELDETRQAVGDALVACGIAGLSNEPAVSLSTGQRRLVELARAMASRSVMLLLDEPSSGLDHRETEAFGEILVDLVRTRGVGILLVEHDMSLVMRISHHVYVLDFGRLIFNGTPVEAAASLVVREAYLGGVLDEVSR